MLGVIQLERVIGMERHLTVDQKIEIMKLAIQFGSQCYADQYKKMISLIEEANKCTGGIKEGQIYLDIQCGGISKVINPSMFDENGEEYFTEEIYDKIEKKWDGVSLRHYKTGGFLRDLALIEDAV